MASSRWTAVAALALVAATAPFAGTAAAGAQAAGNTLSVSATTVSVGQVITVTGRSFATCTGAPVLSVRPASAPAGPGPVLTVFPAPVGATSWTYNFAVPGFLPGAGAPGTAVGPGTYRLVNACNGKPPSSPVTLTVTASADPQRFVAMAATADGSGYWLAQSDGAVHAFGDARALPPLAAVVPSPAAPVVAMAATPDGGGYWLAGADGGVYAFGDAPFLGSLPGLGVHPAAPVTGIAATADGRGYWLVSADGGVYSFGDAPFLGSATGGPIAQPVSAIAAAPGGPSAGYLVASEYTAEVDRFSAAAQMAMSGPLLPPGGIAPFMAVASATASGPSAWTAQTTGGVYDYDGGGGAPGFYGSLPGLGVSPAAPVVAMAATPDRRGYWLLGADGGVFAFGDAPFLGSAAVPPSVPACRAGQFRAEATTAAPSYAQGQPVAIALTITNTGPACSSFPTAGNADVLSACPSVTVTTAGGTPVWSSAADPGTGVVCPAVGVGGSLSGGWSRTTRFTWGQQTCPASGTACTEQPVAAGSYTVGSGTWPAVPVPPAPVTIR